MVKTKNNKEKPEKNEEELVEDFLNQLLKLIGTEAKAKAKKDNENSTINVDIKGGSETGLLIGNRGRTLQSIQIITGLMLRKKIGNWIRILVNIGDWREKEEERLRELAWQTVERVRETGKEQLLYNLTSAQRRIIHLVLADEKDIKTSSEGEGKERYLIISPVK
ncbi:hypothetical protein A2159_00290 [Candidatus Woesebacteria bacterium RBG_13_34_9]|uniref:R3H domain-containing protein n=1 Tax=Candidatus Woesebacteria bacterium RBG_13_34_9 TaxID=1802477 RepID=A0A1F7X4D4_9BACT|nr:MAG: hypothetical protein A2159_00290 [Candidatus Woesebacteria bacterium RBG_13_34_9]